MPTQAIDDLDFECTNGVPEHSRDVARMAALPARPPSAVPAVTFNRVRGDVELAGTTIGRQFVNRRRDAVASTESIGETAENRAEAFAISREQDDRFALESYRRAIAAQREGRFADEVPAVDVPDVGVAVVGEDCRVAL